MDDVRKTIYSTVAVFVIGILAWIGYIYVSACGFTTSCQKGAAIQPAERTPIPTLVPATLPVGQLMVQQPTVEECEIATADLIGAWVSAGYPQGDTFNFVDKKGWTCQAIFNEDVEPLFTKADVWFPGSLACATCHSADIATASAQLDLSTYEGILAGSRRSEETPKGNDILADGNWNASLLYETLYVRKFMPPGHPPELPAEGPVIFAGTPVNK